MPRTLGLVGHGLLYGVERGAHLVWRIADQRGQQRSRPEAPMRRAMAAIAIGRRVVVEQHVAAAVHLNVDEAGREPGAFRQSICAGMPQGSSDRGRSAAMWRPSITTAQSWCRSRAVEDGAGCDRVLV